MIRLNELKEFNEKTFDEYSPKHKHFQLGFFEGNHILFVGIRPGRTIDKKTQEDTQKVQEQKTFETFENEYVELIKNSKIGEFITGICGEKYHHISLTNICKTASETNDLPTEEEKKEGMKILKQQIEFLNPNVIILLGNYTAECFSITHKNDFILKDKQTYFYVEHPSYLLRVGSLTRRVNDIKFKLNEFFKTHAITRITKRNVYYRDVEFYKCVYENIEEDLTCFMESKEESEYKSFDGKNLKKIYRGEIGSYKNQETYEEHLTKKDLFYYNNLKNLSHSKMIRCMYLDIETNFGNDVLKVDKEITSIAFYDTLGKKYYVYVLKNKNKEKINDEQFKEAYVIEFDDELSLLANFLRIIDKFDLVSGWYSGGFDIPYILNRSRKLGISLHDYFKNFYFKPEDNNGDLRVYNDSIIFYDALEFYREKGSYYSKPPSYSLDAVATHLGIGKKIEHQGLEKLWEEDINKLIEYNLHDVKLLKGIIEIANIVNYPLQLQQLCPQDFENVFWNSRTIENLLHHRYWNKKIYFPTKKDHDKPDFEGAAVFDMVPGIHKNVASFDFSAMYTNIIMSWNLSADTLVGEKIEVENNWISVLEDLKKRYPELKDKQTKIEELILVKNDFGEFYFLSRNYREGILPALEREMIESRKELQRLRDSYPEGSALYKVHDDLQGTRKQILNSIYGVNGYSRFIMFDVRISSAITSIGRQLLHWCEDIVNKNNLRVIVADTDSLYISFGEDLKFEDFILKAQNFEKELNSSLKEFMKKFTSNTSVIEKQTNEIEFEKAYSKLLLTDVKKRYFGYLKFYKGKFLDKEKFSVTGFETRRQDTPFYFNKILLNVYKMLLEDNSTQKLREYYKTVRDEIKTVSPEDLTIKIKLAQNIEEYKNIPIHVRAIGNSGASLRRGDLVRMLYVKDKREVIHYDPSLQLQFEIDCNKYLKNFLINKIRLINKEFNINPTLLEYG